MKYFDRKSLSQGAFGHQHHRLARSYVLALGLIGLLALASLGLLIAQIDSQGRYARMIDHRETQRFLTLHAALFSMLLGPESDPIRRKQYRRTIVGALGEIERLQRLFPAQAAREDPPTANLAAQLRWFAASERSVLAGSADLSSFLAAVPSALRDAFDAAIESERAASLRLSHRYQGLATGAVCILLLTLVAEARWIFQPLARGIRRETRALAESRQRLGAVLETVGEAIMVTDARNVIQTVNSEAARVWGCLSEDLVGLKLNALVLAGRDLEPEAWRAMFPAAGRLETVGTRQDGEPFGLELSLTRTLLPGPDGAPEAGVPEREVFTISARDITARLESARQLAGALDAALDAARAKSAFVAGISHEIRGPLDAWRGDVNQLAQTALTAEQRGLVEHIVRHGNALHAVVDELLDFSNLATGRLTLESADFDLRQLVESAADVVAGRAVQKQLELLAFVAPDVPTALRGDAGRLRQVLLNLLGNALKFTRAGEVIAEVALEAAGESEATLRFSVRDTGIGIAPEDRSRLFRAPAPGEEMSAARAGGRGLGLTICRQLAERMGGGIGVESTPGRGSTFWFTARLERQAVRSEPALAEERAERERIASLRDVRILVVDDNATCRNLVSARLAAWGMIPAAAESGGAALAQLREQALAGTPFEVAMLDLNLGSMDGFTLAWAIHSQPMLAQTRLLLVTALGLETDRAADRRVGILGSVSKPLKYGAVLQELAKVVAEENPVVGTILNGRLEMQPVRTPRIDMTDAPLRTGGRRVLLADDNPINRKMALRQLANMGFAADAVGNGREALAALRAQPYGLVILDVHMPVMDGYDTARTIRRLLQKQRQDHLALVAMTANRTNGDRQRCLDAGMDDYLSKPVRQEELGRVLARWNGADGADGSNGANGGAPRVVSKALPDSTVIAVTADQ
jgi:PAS domain S-box-containing protein